MSKIALLALVLLRWGQRCYLVGFRAPIQFLYFNSYASGQGTGLTAISSNWKDGLIMHIVSSRGGIRVEMEHWVGRNPQYCYKRLQRWPFFSTIGIPQMDTWTNMVGMDPYNTPSKYLSEYLPIIMSIFMFL